MTGIVYGCDTCRTTLGRAGCPTHRNASFVPQTPTYAAAPVFTFEDKERLFRRLDRIVELLEVLTGVRR